MPYLSELSQHLASMTRSDPALALSPYASSKHIPGSREASCRLHVDCYEGEQVRALLHRPSALCIALSPPRSADRGGRHGLDVAGGNCLQQLNEIRGPRGRRPEWLASGLIDGAVLQAHGLV